ncbi:XdhC family protein [Kribbella solani]|uniref:Xanthine dehydrogenase accessory factor n=1 Tax=Kribbella solani TaxID=236067 RepID=A0A841DMR1_9ACTN|nr:XdhC/CoxI family protein [Kribbella solani]MBB5979181.1 xanthine dehydrogenase accessory factor [Kribbella solani]
MRDVLDRLLTWWKAGESVAVGTVVATFESAPRPPGAVMLVGPGAEAVGSVSGGCVEGAVYQLGEEILASGKPVLQRYGVSDESAFAVGLTCGGIIDVFVERVDRTSFPELAEVAADIAEGRPVAVATVVAHPDPTRLGRRLIIHPDNAAGTPNSERPHSTGGTPSSEEPGAVGGTVGSEGSGGAGGGLGSERGRGFGGSLGSEGSGGVGGSLGSERADDAVLDDARGLLANGRTETLEYGPDGQRRGEGMRVFVSSYAPVPRLLVFGAIDFAAAVARIGSFLGYRVTVCDARAVFATASRFPSADEVIVDWPHRYLSGEAAAGRIDDRTVICLLTHDPKFDVPLLEVALRLPPLAYIGAMGSRRTHDDRLKRLREAGLTETELARLSSPIGLDLGARTPEETAVSIAAEFIAQRWGGAGQPLSTAAGPIHHQPTHD